MPPDDELVRDRETIFDGVDRGIANLREQQAVSQVEASDDSFGAPKLEDVDGIGPSTAKKLERAGVDRPEELARLTPSQIAAVDGVGPKRADKLASQFQFQQSTRFEKPQATPEDVREAQADRSPEARRADRSFNAEVTLDEEEWLEDPNGLDFPGVDTIPEQRRAERAREAAKRSGVSDVEATSLSGKAQGNTSGGNVKIDASGADPVSTLAHEVGHNVEPERGYAEENIFGDDEELRNQAAKLSVRTRFTLGDTTPDNIRDAFQQDEDSELFADAVGAAIEEPQAARREAPELLSEIESEFGGILPGNRN